MMGPGAKYTFSWESLGDLDAGRPNLGKTVRLECYRLMQFSLREMVEKRYGTDAADDVFYEAGKLAGFAFAQHLLTRPEDLSEYVAELQRVLREMGIGILRVEKADPATGEFVVTVSEDLDCSGLPETGDTACAYDEGFIAALLESYTGRRFVVNEIDCWCTGERMCRFAAAPEA